MARSVYNPGFANPATQIKDYTPPPKYDPVEVEKPADYGKNLKDRYGRDFARPNWAQEQFILKQLEKAPDRFKQRAETTSKQTIKAFEGLSGYKFSINDDGTLKVEADPTTRKGWKEDEAVTETLNQMGQNVYSSHARKVVGEALAQFGKHAASTLSQYANNIIDLNEQRHAQETMLNSDLIDYISKDAQYLSENPPPPPADIVHPPMNPANIPYGQTVEIRRSYNGGPQEEALKKMYPGFSFVTSLEKDQYGNDLWVTRATRDAHADPNPPDWMQPASVNQQVPPGGRAQLHMSYNEKPDYGALSSMYPDFSFETVTKRDEHGREYYVTYGVKGGAADTGTRSGSDYPQGGSPQGLPQSVTGADNPVAAAIRGQYQGPQWFGEGNVNRDELAKAWGVKPGEIGVTRRQVVTAPDGRTWLIPTGVPRAAFPQYGVPANIQNVRTVNIARPKKSAR